ncbi:helix-turn-helix transcriptional regulator [Paracoccus onubensis]|uniref:XRE family transcriptional regulator n=1 Tax=Paracoccus onubensis TaxID=1675788 RepID=A0A418T4E8_9RHOB|nr:XRE family transcriptional regulator [Paracoccus onubensis]
MATLKHHLEASGETQADFAMRINVRQGTVSKLVRGVMFPSLKLAQRIERATSGRVAVSSWDTIDPISCNPNQSETSNEQSKDSDAA